MKANTKLAKRVSDRLLFLWQQLKDLPSKEELLSEKYKLKGNLEEVMRKGKEVMAMYDEDSKSNKAREYEKGFKEINLLIGYCFTDLTLMVCNFMSINQQSADEKISRTMKERKTQDAQDRKAQVAEILNKLVKIDHSHLSQEDSKKIHNEITQLSDKMLEKQDEVAEKLLEKPPIPAFFATLNEAETSQLSNYQLLDRLSSDVTDITALKLYYTLASVSYKAGEITETQRNDFVIKVLEAVPEKFKFDKDAHIAAAVKSILRKAQKDGILDKHNCDRLDRLVERADFCADVRFTGLIEGLSNLELRVDYVEAEIGRLDRRVDGVVEYTQKEIGRIHKRIDSVQAYTEKVDRKLRDFKKQYKKHLKRKAAASYVSAVVGIVTFGIGSKIIDAASDGSIICFDKIVDFSDPQEVDSAFEEYHELFMEKVDEKLEDWAEKPLKDAVKDVKDDDSSNLPALAMLKACTLLNTSYSKPSSSSPLPPPPPTSETLGDANESFSKLKKLLGLGGGAFDDVPIDDKFMDGFEKLFKIKFSELGSNTKEKCALLVGSSSKSGKIRLMHWRDFYETWQQSGQSMSDYLQSESVSPPPPAQSDLGDEADTFAKLKEFLDLGEDEKEIPVDDDFMCAFEGLFKINFNKLGSDIEKSCRRLVDRNSKGKIKLLHWRVFYQTWLQSGQSMAEYLKSESA